jgi:D-sedoheptulose 7-phosphate isomerase
MGNGGSAADAQHMAAELIGRFKIERPPIPSIALTVNTSVLTCLSNDYDYSIVFSRQLEALCQPHDVVIGISTSGNSKNVIKGIAMAKQKGAFTIGLAGCSGGELAKAVDLCLTISSTTTARVQEAHLFIEHVLCEYLESAMYQEKQTCQQENVIA